MPVTAQELRAFKEEGRRFAMLTAYDFPTARLLDEAGIPVLLVGDSLGMVVLGYESTLPVTMDEMLHHTRAVARGTTDALVVADMPFMSYQASVEEGLRNAGRFLKEAGAAAVKLEGGRRVVDLTERLTAAGIPVMGHLGLTPQSIHQLGGYRVQGRREEQAQSILADAKDLVSAGIFALVLEAVPASLAAAVTASVEVPTIGIGAGPHCDGQVLVFHDFAGIAGEVAAPKFVKAYAEVGEAVTAAARRFAQEVEEGLYPGTEHTYQ